jgi:hypothetical protein
MCKPVASCPYFSELAVGFQLFVLPWDARCLHIYHLRKDVAPGPTPTAMVPSPTPTATKAHDVDWSVRELAKHKWASAFSAKQLAMLVEEAGELDDVTACVDWATDYIQSCLNDPESFRLTRRYHSPASGKI